MLSVALIGSHQEHYYTSLAAEDYYTAGGEPEGVWRGSGAAALGLQGAVSRDDLSLLMRGYSPSSVRLVRNAGSATRRAGFDLTFSADKTVSVLGFALGDDYVMEEVRRAHAQAVERALAYLEDSAAHVRRGVNGESCERATLIAACYEHSTARLVSGASVPDPHLHTHCVVINAGVTADGGSGTLDSRQMFRHKMAAGAVYRAELFEELELRLGEAPEKRGRFFALRSVPKALAEHFSKRRHAIEVHLKEQGLEGTAQESESAAKRTRTTKPTVERASFIRQWRETARELMKRLGQAERPLKQAEGVRHRLSQVELGEVVTAAATGITDRQSHFAEVDLVRAVAEAVEGSCVGAEALLHAARAHIREQLVVAGVSAGEVRYTTHEMLLLEKRLLEQAASLALTTHRVSHSVVQEVLASRSTISEEQRQALLEVTQGAALSLVRGVAGTGKTYLLDSAREAWEAQGFQVIGCSLAAAAAKRLEEGSGIKSEYPRPSPPSGEGRSEPHVEECARGG